MTIHKKVGIGAAVAAFLIGAVSMATPRHAEAACGDTNPLIYCGQKFEEGIKGSIGYNRGPDKFGSSDYDKATGIKDAAEKCHSCLWKSIERPGASYSPKYYTPNRRPAASYSPKYSTPSSGGASR
jgi:hypothetical protein